jgi:hypothetical protein
MSKMRSHDPFNYLKYKLWPKERMQVKLPFWLLTIKSTELLWFPCMKVTCHISLESSLWGLQLCLRPHLNRRFTHNVMGLQSCESPNFETPNLGVPWQNDIWVLASWPGIKYTIRVKVVASPKFGPWWVLWACVCSWLERALMVF